MNALKEIGKIFTQLQEPKQNVEGEGQLSTGYLLWRQRGFEWGALLRGSVLQMCVRAPVLPAEGAQRSGPTSWPAGGRGGAGALSIAAACNLEYGKLGRLNSALVQEGWSV